MIKIERYEIQDELVEVSIKLTGKRSDMIKLDDELSSMRIKYTEREMPVAHQVLGDIKHSMQDVLK